MTFSPGSRSRLTRRNAARFDGDSLFARLARTVCEAECLPRKELYEAWELARRTRRIFRGRRVVDLAAGHGLVAFALLLLDNSSTEAICVDPRKPMSASRLESAIVSTWPRLANRVRYLEVPLEAVPLTSADLVVSAHACGSLTDDILRRACDARAALAVMPCCHNLDDGDCGGLDGWLPGPLAMDAVRAMRVRACGYKVYTQHIPETITPQNRLLLGDPGCIV